MPEEYMRKKLGTDNKGRREEERGNGTEKGERRGREGRRGRGRERGRGL